MSKSLSEREIDPANTSAELLTVLPFLNRLMVEEVRREAGPDTTMPQFRVLQFLSNGPMSLSELARQRRVSLQSMGELAQALVDRGWVARRTNPIDRRQQLVELTRLGRRHYLRAQDNMLKRLTPLMAQLSQNEHVAVRTALSALHRVLTETMGDTSATAPVEAEVAR